MSRPLLPVVLLLLDVVCSVALAVWTSGCSGQTVLDERNGAALVQTGTTPPMVDSDDVPAHTVVLSAADGGETRLPHTRAAALWPTPAGVDRVVVVDHDARLFVQQGAARRALLDQVVGTPVVLDSQRVLAARETEPGESDLWILTADGQPPRALAAAPGADDSAFVLDDGRVLFVSGRTGVASLWVVAADPAATPRQLTNQGQRPGALTSSFVPPPAGPVRQQGQLVVYDIDGVLWQVNVTSGAAAPVGTRADVQGVR
jgi:hypothetical protein